MPRTARPTRCSGCCCARGGSRAGRSTGSRRATPRASSTARPRCSSTWRRGRSPGSTGASTPAAARPLAIKVLRQRFAAIPEAVHRFHKEAEAGMRLRHPNIVQIIDVGQQDNRHFMIMEYVEGMNLRDFLKLRARIKAHQALPLMLGLAAGPEVFASSRASPTATSRGPTS